MVPAKRPGARDRDYVKVGNIKIRWTKFADGRTCLDLRKWRQYDRRPTFADHAEAILAANRIAIELNSGGRASQTLTNEDRALFAQARAAAAEFGSDLPRMIAEWREAQRVIAAEPAHARAPFPEVIAAGIKALRRPVHLTVDVALELLMSKSGEDYDGRYWRDLKQYVIEFAQAFPGDIAAVTPKEIEEWLEGLRRRDGKPLSDSRRNHAHSFVAMLFRFARAREYLPDRRTAVQKVPERNAEAKAKTDFFTIPEMQAVLDLVEESWQPFFTIVGFSGCRVEEISRSHHSAKRKDWLKWEDFDWAEREIIIRPEVAKTRKFRRIPIFNNLWEFLAPWRDRGASGYVIGGSVARFRERLKRQLRKARTTEAANLAGLEEKEFLRLSSAAQKPFLAKCLISEKLIGKWSNQMRHCYGTYRMAQTKGNKHQVSAEMGNSPGMIESHYDGRAPASHGDAWFHLFPAAPSNVTQLHLALLRA